MSRHEVYGYEKLICYGLKGIFYHIFKGLTTEQAGENNRNCVGHSAPHRKYKRPPCGILRPFMLAALLEIFHKTTQKDTAKLKSFLWQQKERK